MTDAILSLQRHPLPSRWRIACVTAIILTAAQNSFAQDDFASLLTSQTRETFVAIRDYANSHAEAADRPAAVLWLMRTAPEWGWEVDVIPLAEQMLQENSADVETIQIARSVVALGLAQQGDATGAIAALDDFVKSLRLRNPNAAIDLCQSVALRLQLRGDSAGATAVYDRLSGAFFLNQEVREAAEGRKSRLELLGKNAPAIDVSDIDSAAWSWDDRRGRIVLLDFWATNCRPCLDELPRLKQLVRELQPRGLDVLGISLDDDAATVKAFRESQRITWRIALDAGKVTPEYRVRLIPSLMLVDRTGKIAAVDVRPADLRWTALRLLEQTPTAR
jgi:peroxiredoxin